MNMHRGTHPWTGGRAITASAGVLALAAIAATGVFARSAAAPQNTAAPTISGTAREGNTLTANDGTWSNTPTAFTYQWQRCDTGGATPADNTRAPAQNHTGPPAERGPHPQGDDTA